MGKIINPDRFVWVDIETTGLNHLTDLVLEVGVVITDLDLNVIDDHSVQLWNTPMYDRKWEHVADVVRDMHTKSNLIEVCRNAGLSATDAEDGIYAFLDGHCVAGDAMCGSSVHFDHAFITEQFPSVAELFGYRHIDVSTIKEVCGRLNPRILEKLDEMTHPQKLHRAIPDIHDTIGEFKFYCDNFLHVAPALFTEV